MSRRLIGPNPQFLHDPPPRASAAASSEHSNSAHGFDLAAHMATILEFTDDAIIGKSTDGVIRGWNAGAERLYGFARDEIVGRHISVIVPPERMEELAALERTVARGERVERVETVRLRKGGDRARVSLTLSPIVDASGRVIGTASIAHDITRRHVAEAALRESEARLRLLADSVPALIWMSGVDRACTWVNQRWLAFTGRSTEEALAGGWTLDVHPQDARACEEVYASAFEACEPFELEFRMRRHDGEYRWVRAASVPLHLDNGEFAGFIGSCVDVTDRKLGEELLLQRVSQRTRELTVANEQLQHQIEERLRVEAVLAAENRILEWIASGAAQHELLNAICRETETLVPGTRCAIRIRDDAVAGDPYSTAQRPPRDSETFGSIAELGIAPETCSERQITPRVATDDPLALHGVQSHWREPLVGVGGVLLGTLGVYCTEPAAPDEHALAAGTMAARLAAIVVERARAETRARNQLTQLAHVARLATMGEMASGIAHELNQPLCAIVNFAEACIELVQRGASDGPQLSKALSDVARQAQRAGEVIRRLRDFVKRREPLRRPIDLNAVVREVVAMTASEARVGEVRVRTKLARRLPRAYADAIQIEQVLVNLVRNASDALRNVPAAKRELVIETIPRRGAVEVRVADSGPGISSDVLERLFEPFFTTKPDGMGMGLSISRSILEVHDGRLWATSRAGGGSAFHFTLPTAWRIRHGGRNDLRRG